MTALTVALLVTGALLVVAEAHVASYGVLGVAGRRAARRGGLRRRRGRREHRAGARAGRADRARAGRAPRRRRAQVARCQPPAARGGADGLVGRIGVVRHARRRSATSSSRASCGVRASWADEDAVLREGEHIVVEKVHGLTLSVRVPRSGRCCHDRRPLIFVVTLLLVVDRRLTAARSGSCASTSAPSSSGSAACSGEKGPGLILLIPAVDRMVRVDLRTVTLDIPPQNLITRDNVPAKVNAVCYFRVVDAPRAVVDVERYLRRDFADRPDDAALGARQGRPRHPAVRARAAQRGAPAHHRRAHRPVGHQGHDGRDQGRRDPGRDAACDGARREAERERRAKIIHAEGEYQASQRLRDAADVISGNPAVAAAALPPDADRDRRDAELDGRVPAARSTSSSRSSTAPLAKRELLGAACRRAPAGLRWQLRGNAYGYFSGPLSAGRAALVQAQTVRG